MSPIALPTPPETPSLTPHLKPTTLPPHTTHTTHTTQTTHTPTAQLHHATPQPLAVSAEGMYVHLADGRTLLDSVSGGAAVASLGMGNAEVVQTMTDQAAKMAYAYHQLLGSGPGEELAEWLVSRGKGRFEAAAFLNSGSEAMEACIKLCRQYWVEKGERQRKYIIARFPSYHGNTLGALAVGNVPPRRDLYTPLFSDFIHHVSSPTYKRSHLPSESEEAYSLRLASELESKILELGAENIMAFVAEPVVGAALGVMPPPKGYFPAINAVVRKHNLLFVMDEVMSGSGRVGELFAHDAVAEGVTPDIMAMAKGLGAGYVTISAVLVNPRVAEMVREAGQWKNSHTYQNHPVNCAVAKKVMEITEREGLMENVKARGAQLLEELTAALEGVKGVYDVRGTGLFVGIELDAPADLKPRMAARVKARCFELGLLVLGLSGTVDGKQGETIVLAPAYIATPEQISDIARIVVQSVTECAKEL